MFRTSIYTLILPLLFISTLQSQETTADAPTFILNVPESDESDEISNFTLNIPGSKESEDDEIYDLGVFTVYSEQIDVIDELTGEAYTKENEVVTAFRAEFNKILNKYHNYILRDELKNIKR